MFDYVFNTLLSILNLTNTSNRETLCNQNSHSVEYQDATIDLSQTFPNEPSGAKVTLENELEDDLMSTLSEIYRAESENDWHTSASKGDTNQSEIHRAEAANDRSAPKNEGDTHKSISNSFKNIESKRIGTWKG